MSDIDIDPEDSFALELAKKHDEILQGQRAEEAAAGVDPAIEEAIPVLNLIEEVRRFQESNSQSLIDTPPVGSTDGVPPADALGIDYRETQRVGRFAIHEQLGQGGFGVVFRATDTTLGREVAIKIPRFEASLSEDSRRRFKREAQAAAALSHQNIVSVYDTDSEQGVEFIVCELVVGQDLAKCVAMHGPFAAERAANMLVELCHALEHAHGRGVLHRDLKPSNVLLEAATNRARISDFGLASIVDSTQEVTQSGAALGTPAYMSPEQAAGEKRALGPATDIYGLGAILYYVLSGKAPFDGHSAVETLRAVTKDEPRSLGSLGVKVPIDLEAICHKCLEKSPAGRYASAQELGQDLQRFLDGKPVSARPVTGFTRARRWAARNPLVAGPAIAALFFLVAALAATSYGLFTTNRALTAKTLAEQETRQKNSELKEAVDTYFREIESDPVLKSTPGAEPLRQRLLNHARDFYQQFIAQNAGNDEFGFELADTELRVGKILAENGNYQEALKSFRAAEARIEDIADGEAGDSAQDGQTLQMLQGRAAFHIATTQFSIGNTDDAEAQISRAIALQREYLANHQSDFQAQEALAKSLQNGCEINTRLSNQQTAISQGEEAAQIYDELMADDETGSTGVSQMRATGALANAYASFGDYAKAEAGHLRNFDEAQEILADNPNQWAVNEVLLFSAIQSTPFAFMRNDFESPLERLLFAEGISKRLCELHPDNRKFVDYRLGIIQRLAACYDHGKEDASRAQELTESVVALSRELAEGDQATFEDRLGLCGALVNLIGFQSAHNLLEDTSQDLIDEAALLAAALHAEQPKHEGAHTSLVHAHRSQALLHEKKEDRRGTIDSVSNAIRVMNDLLESGANHPQTIHLARALHAQRAKLSEEDKRYAEALDDRKLQLEFSIPLNDTRRAQLALAAAHLRVGQAEEASKQFAKIEFEELPDDESELVARYRALRYAASSHSDSDSAAKAIAILTELKQKNYFDSPEHDGNLEHPDFDSLRELESFQDIQTSTK